MKTEKKRFKSDLLPCSSPGIPESQDGDSPSTVSPLVVMVIYKDNSSVGRHETPAFSPVPEQQEEIDKLAEHAL